jgi:hypothetical protein
MTLREATALIRLYRACLDEALRARARELVPELEEFDEEVSAPNSIRRWLLIASVDGYEVGRQTVACAEADLEAHRKAFGADLALMNDVAVTSEPAP